MCCNFTAQAIQLSTSRIIYNESRKEVLYRITNSKSSSPYLVQSWVSTFDSNDATKNFIVTPPLVNMPPDAVNDLRIMFSAHQSLPQDHESIFRLNVLSIPAVKDTGSAKVVLTSKASLKLIYRPSGLNSHGAKESLNKLIVKKMSNKLVLSNPTPYFISLREASINGKRLMGDQFIKISTIDPFSTVEVENIKVNVSTFDFSAIDDYGAAHSSQIKFDAIRK